VIVIRRVLFIVAGLVAASAQASTTISFGARNVYFKEGSGTGTIQVTRSTNLNATEKANYSWSFWGGPSGSGTLTFDPGETSKTFTITIPNDSYFGGETHGDAYLSQNGTNIAWMDVIIDDDEPEPVLTGSAVSVAEGNSGTTAVTLHFTLSAPVKDVPWLFLQTSGTATKDVDFTVSDPPQTSLHQTSFDVVVNIKGDVVPEPDETFVVTLGFWTGYPVLIHGDATVTILNDEYIWTAASQQIERGTTASLDLSTSVAAGGADHIELTSNDPAVATVPPFIDVPAGTTSAAVPVTAVRAGVATISAKLPASRGGEVVKTDILVYERSGLTFEAAIVAMEVGGRTTVKAHLTPPSPVTLLIKNSRPSVAEMPITFEVDGNGNGSIPIHAIGTGNSDVLVALPAVYGGETAGFRVDVSPSSGLSISSLSTKSGPATGNQPVTLSGANIKGRCVVTFGGVSALNTAVAANGSVSTTTPPHAAGVVDVGIRCGTAESVLPGAYTYTAAPLRLTGIAPATGSISGGTIVTASGENLPRGRCGLWFGDTPATTLTNLQTSEMSAVAPAHGTGLAAVTLRCGSDASALTDAFLYTAEEPLAQISAVSPAAAAPGERVLVGGTRFRVDDAIAFGIVPIHDMTTAPGAHFVTIPDLSSGPVSIALRDANGRVVTGPSFIVKPPSPPQLTAAPAKVTAGAELVVNGSGFRPSFDFAAGGVTLPRIVATSTYAVLRMPKSMPPQATSLVLRDAGGAPLATRPIEVTSSGVAVESVTPPCVSTEGGAFVTITGSGFVPGAVVAFGVADGTETVVRDEHTITVRVPASSGVSDAVLTVTNPSLESGQLTDEFQYRWPDSACGKPRRRTSGR